MKLRVVGVCVLLSAAAVLSSCSKEKENSPAKSQWEKDEEMVETQKEYNQDSVSRKVSGTAVGTSGGAAMGAATGAGIGATVGSIVPGAGTAVGAGVGAIIGSIAGGIGGGVSGFVLAPGEMSEYIKVETDFKAAQEGKNVESKPSLWTSDDYISPKFVVGRDVTFTITMETSLLEKAKKASKKQTSEDILIPVEIVVTKSKNVEVLQTGGINGKNPEIEIDGTVHYHFHIKNNKSPTEVILTFTPAEEGNARIELIYGLPEYKIVDSNCDVFQMMKFVREEY